MKVTVADYLVKKLKFLGIKNVFGLPGDYNFNILDAIIKDDEINWVNSTNELNASYSSDGYARINGYGAVVTTYGVGELSAINGIAGSMAENVPVIHIAGVPKTSFIEKNIIVHHNFSNPNYYLFENAYKNVVETTAYLNFENAKKEIDRVFNVFVNEKKPVYIAIPVDVCEFLIDDYGFDKIEYKKSDEKALNETVSEIISLIEKAKNPIIFFDYLCKRYNLKNEIKEFINKTNMKFGTFLMGKGIIDETNPNFTGVNGGNLSSFVQNEIKKSDLIITAGYLNADLNTGGFSAFEKEIDIEIRKNETIIKGKVYKNVLLQDVILKLNEKITKTFEKNDFKQIKKKINEKGKIKVDDILPLIETVLDEDDIFTMETGLFSLSGSFLNLKKNVEYLSQTLWGSIGWATPALFGAMMADNKKCHIMFTGEGAHQLTIQEMANFFEYDLKPVIFVLNNNGYTVERVLSKDPNDKFNNITNWNYPKLIEGFSNNKDYFIKTVSTLESFIETIDEIKKLKGKKLCYVEIMTDKKDYGSLCGRFISNMKHFSSNLW